MKEITVVEQREVLGKDFKVYGTIQEPLFLAKNVAEWIDYDISSINKMLANIDDDEKVRKIIPTLGGDQKAWLLTEDGLYEVLMQSSKPIAKQFKKEVKKILKEIRLNGYYVAPAIEKKSAEEMQYLRDRLEKERREIDLERARFLRNLSISYNGKSQTYPQVLDAYAVHEIVGAFALPLPETNQRLMSAGEVGKVLGISANKVGIIANKHGLKEPKYGSWCRDKSKYSNKEVDSFRYNEEGLEKIKSIVEKEQNKED